MQESFRLIKEIKIANLNKYFASKFISSNNLTAINEFKHEFVLSLPRYWFELIAIIGFTVLILIFFGPFFIKNLSFIKFISKIAGYSLLELLKQYEKVLIKYFLVFLSAYIGMGFLLFKKNLETMSYCFSTSLMDHTTMIIISKFIFSLFLSPKHPKFDLNHLKALKAKKYVEKITV